MVQERHSGNGTQVETAVYSVSESNIPLYQNCPYFGLQDDAGTSLLFPSSVGCCHRARPPELVQLAHQETHCLTARHKSCPVYLQPAPLPAMLRIEEGMAGNGRSWGKVGVTLLLVLLAAALAVAWNSGLIALTTAPENAMPPDAPTTAAVVVPTLMPTSGAAAFILPSATPRPHTPTSSPTAVLPPTFTPIPTVALPATFTATPASPRALIAIAPINLRTGPDTSYPVLQTIRIVGERYDVVGQLAGGGWWQICCVNGVTGWINGEGISLEGELATVSLLPLPNPQVQVLVERLNARTGPTQEYPTLAILVADDVLDVVGRLADNTWWQVCCIDDELAWVFGEGVALWGIADVVPVVAAPEP